MTPPSPSATARAAGSLEERVEALRRSRPAEAFAVLESGFAEALKGAAPARRGSLWRMRGHVLRSLRRLQPATRSYRRAQEWFRRAGDSREVGRCAIGLVDALMYLGRYREAEAAARDGRRRLEIAGDWEAQARLLNNEGNLHHRLDRPDRALERYRRAHRALGRAGDRQAQAMVEANIANCLSVLGRSPEARRLYRTSRRVHARRGFALHALRTEYNLAYLDFLEHRHERALDQLEDVRERARADGVPSLAALSSLDRAEILLRLGDHASAIEEALQAASAFAGLSMGYERAKAETFAALAEFRLGRPAAARARLERTLAAFLTEGNEVWAGEALVGLATSWWSDGSPGTSAPLLAAAARRFARARDREREGCALALLARARLLAGKRMGGRALVRARELARSRGSARLRHLVWVASAEEARRQGRGDEARRLLRRAALESERLASRILDEQWRASFWGDWGWPHQELSALELEEGRLEAAFEALERGRGRALASPWRGKRAGKGDSVRAWAAGRLARDRDRTTRSGALPSVEYAPDRHAGRNGTARALRLAVGPESIRADALRASLPENALLLDYAMPRGVLSAFALDRAGLEAAPSLVATAEITRLVHDALFELRRGALDSGDAGASESLNETLSQIASLVLWPLLPDARRAPERLVVVAAGPLTRLPWAALPLPDGRRVCEAFEVVIVPGLRLGLRRPGRSATGRPLVVASSADGLQSVAAEAAAVRRAFSHATVLEGEDATASAFLELARDASWIHFAGHGLFQAGRSGLRFRDRWLLAEELDGIRLSARGVTLSACQTARALVGPGEEWFGMARTLLLGGAEAVLAAQWDVEDARAAAFMIDLYQCLGQGYGLAQALSRAQAEQVRRGLHPVHWSGYVVLGGPSSGSSRLRKPQEIVKTDVLDS